METCAQEQAVTFEMYHSDASKTDSFKHYSCFLNNFTLVSYQGQTKVHLQIV